jgi:hypothetical protein
MPISQAPSRKPKMDREIREHVNLYGLLRRPAEPISLYQLMASEKFRLFRRPAELSTRYKDVAECPFFGARHCVRARSVLTPRGRQARFSQLPNPASLEEHGQIAVLADL